METAVDYLEERMECGGITWEDIQQAKEQEKLDNYNQMREDEMMEG
jgi:hypothetical protein